MPTFLARQYVRSAAAVSRTERAVGVVILLVVAGLVGTFVLQLVRDRGRMPRAVGVEQAVGPAASGPTDPYTMEHVLPRLFPEPGVAGWQAPRRAERFAPDELYQKIDGMADAYIALGVRQLTFASYVAADDPSCTIDVYWYEFDTAKNAALAYGVERPTDTTPLSIGTVGYESFGSVFFQQGTSYVQVLPSRGSVDAAAARSIAERLAARVAESGGPP